MAPDPDPTIDLASVVDRLRARVAERRAAGEYPPELEAELAEHAAAVLGRPAGSGEGAATAELAALLGAVEATRDLRVDPDQLAVDSRVPGGARIHQLIVRSASRLDQQLADQLQHHASATTSLARAMLEDRSRHLDDTHARLDARVDGVADVVASLRRELGAAEQVLDALVERVASLEASLAAALDALDARQASEDRPAPTDG